MFTRSWLITLTLRRFFNDDSNRLASAGRDGQLFAWHIGEDEGPIYARQLLSLRVAASGSALHLTWLSEDLIAFSAGSTVYLASIRLAGTDTQVGCRPDRRPAASRTHVTARS